MIYYLLIFIKSSLKISFKFYTKILETLYMEIQFLIKGTSVSILSECISEALILSLNDLSLEWAKTLENLEMWTIKLFNWSDYLLFKSLYNKKF